MYKPMSCCTSSKLCIITSDDGGMYCIQFTVPEPLCYILLLFVVSWSGISEGILDINDKAFEVSE